MALRTKDAAASLSGFGRSSLRLRPDRVRIGEERGAEALDLLKAGEGGIPAASARCTQDRRSARYAGLSS